MRHAEGAQAATWADVTAAGKRLSQSSISQLFAQGSGRAQQFTYQVGDLIVDTSRQCIDDAARDALLAHAEASGFSEACRALFSGAHVNVTEGRAALHMALRAPEDAPFSVVGRGSVMSDVVRERERCFAFADAVRRGQVGPFRDVVNIGIGGSDLGPAMAVRALRPYCDGPRVHFVSNADPVHLDDVLAQCDPASTLIVIASKTFQTAETMSNARAARGWLREGLNRDDVGAHLVALSTASDAVCAFGVPDDRRFGFWDWVGGRFSVWSAIGLSVMIAIGPDRFRAFLDGAHGIDEHMRSVPISENVPLWLACITIWNRNVQGAASRAVLPYDQRLELLPAFLQQLDMESTGKAVRADGSAVGQATTPIVWGMVGTNGQHAFHQWLHQGTDPTPCEFLIPALPERDDQTSRHALLVANAIAQAEALLRGKADEATALDLAARGCTPTDIQRLVPHVRVAGNRASTLIFYPRVTPSVLGQLIALNEHRVFAEAVLWGVNAFDQFGVELGKQLATPLTPVVTDLLSGRGHLPDESIADRSETEAHALRLLALLSKEPPTT